MVIGKCTDVFIGIFWLRERLRGRGYVGDLYMEELVTEEDNFHEGGAEFSGIILKINNEKNKYEKVFF